MRSTDTNAREPHVRVVVIVLIIAVALSAGLFAFGFIVPALVVVLLGLGIEIVVILTTLAQARRVPASLSPRRSIRSQEATTTTDPRAVDTSAWAPRN
ncbi:MAG TPA: hypothetical protein VHZ98_09895 [Galbitalea sp.]|nr:hypothetical protein [Galbitalea sp.]